MDENRKENHDQAEELRSILSELQHNQNTEKFDLPNPFDGWGQENDNTKNINVLNLPPRKKVHGQKKTRMHLKVSRPFIRLSVVGILLIALLVIIVFFGEGFMNI